MTSDSTEAYDRGTKFLHYQASASLREYVGLSHRERRVDHPRRLDTGQWLLTTFEGEGAEIELPALSGSMALAELYRKVRFDEEQGG